MQSIKTYKDATDFLFEQLPMFQRIGPKALKLDLSNITALMNALGNPQNDLKCIHVAGTNGKGSVCHYLSSILQEAGYTVGLYTSPHYKDYRERIRYNSQLISKKFVISFLNRLIDKEIMKTISPTFFEIGVAMAFCYFKEMKVDVAVIETGLGGRLDSTNIITPLISIITNIGYDHQATLGTTLTQIAGEKAGIIKATAPVIIGEKQEETTEVFFRKARSLKAPITYAEESEFGVNIKEYSTVSYQQTNIRTALVTIAHLSQFKVSQQHIDLGVANVTERTGYMGRWQSLSQSPKVIAEAAHNFQGMVQLHLNLKLEKFDQLHIVLGMVGDKPLSAVLDLLPQKAKYYFCKAKIPRGKPAELLQSEAADHGLSGKTYTSVRKALSSAKLSAMENDLIIVTGSIFTVAEVV